MARLTFEGVTYDGADNESVLDTLSRHGVAVPFSCRNGICLTCMMRCVEGDVPAKAQAEIRDTLRARGYFLPCVCRPESDLTLARAADGALFGRAVVASVEPLAPRIVRVRLLPATPLYYHAGQFINLRRADGLTRSYSLASVPSRSNYLELHVKALPGSTMSAWIVDELTPETALDIDGPNGACFYVPGNTEGALLLIGNGTGLAPLVGIARDALTSGHAGPIRLYHGSRHRPGLYLDADLRALAVTHDNFDYVACLSGEDVADGYRAGRVEAVAFADHADLKNWRVYLCGYPAMVNAARKTAYLAGAAMADIHADPFELMDKRAVPRE